jgi:8-oxo-dGTP pyrophosphatase MutT (NUDIX family)
MAERLAVFTGLDWAGGPVEAWHGTEPPAGPPVSSACALVTAGADLLLVDVHTRGWDLPGGHLEPGEDPVTALRRELAEEAGLAASDLGDPVLAGWFRLPAATMLVYRMSFTGSPGALTTTVPHEIGAVRFFPPGELPADTADRIWRPFAELP